MFIFTEEDLVCNSSEIKFFYVQQKAEDEASIIATTKDGREIVVSWHETKKSADYALYELVQKLNAQHVMIDNYSVPISNCDG